MKRLVLISIFSLTCLIICNQSLAISNPAAVYCNKLGYEYKVANTEVGQIGICIFPDKTECEEWEFLEGKCGKNYSYCAKNGYDIKTKTDGKNPISPEYATCLIKNSGSIMSTSLIVEEPVTELMNLTKGSANMPSSSKNDNIALSVLSTSNNNIPSSFDWRNVNGSDWITPVKNQDFCGSCWAFAAVAAVEAKINIFRKDPNFDADLSEADVLACSGAGSCDGGYSDMALDYIKNNGVVDENCFSYSFWTSMGITPACSDKCSVWSKRLWKIDSYSSFGTNDRETIKRYMIEKGPIIIYLTMSGTFDINGIYRCSYNDYQKGHAVIIVGYNDTGGYWIFKNSWGNWSEIGYGKLGYDECAMNPISYIEMFPKGITNVNITQIDVSTGDMSGVLSDTYRKDNRNVSLGENCYFGGCNGLSAQISFFASPFYNNMSSVDLMAYHEGRTDAGFNMLAWNGSGWEDYGSIPTSWAQMKYRLCNNPLECSALVYNGNVFANYYHSSCILCDKDYVDIDSLYLEVGYLPKINITSPIDNHIYNSNFIFLNISTEEISKIINVSVDNGLNTTFIDSNALASDLSLPEGQHKLSVYATNYDNNEVSKNIYFIIDVTPPQKIYFNISNSNPKPDEAISFMGEWTDNYNLSYYQFGWNEKGYWVYDQSANFTTNPDWTNVTKNISKEDEGKNISFDLSVYDSANNVHHEYGTINVKDVTPPFIFIDSPLNTTYNSSNISLNAYSYEKTKWTRFSLDDGENQSCFDCISIQYNLTNISDGSHFVTVYASDYSDNQNETVVYFSIDTIPPQVSIKTDKNIIDNRTFHPPFNINITVYDENIYSASLTNIQNLGNESKIVYKRPYYYSNTNFTGGSLDFNYSWDANCYTLRNSCISVTEQNLPVIGNLIIIQGFFKKNETVDYELVSAYFDSENKTLELLGTNNIYFISERLFHILQNSPYNSIPVNATYNDYKSNFTIETGKSKMKGTLVNYYNNSLVTNTSEINFTGGPENGYNVKLGEASAPDGFYQIIVSAYDNAYNQNQSSITLQINNTYICTPNWVLNGTWSPCRISDIQFESYYDSNNCNKPGQPVDINQSCDYCTPVWREFNTSCKSDNSITGYFLDMNNCYSITNLSSDLSSMPANNTYVCDFCTPSWIISNNICEANNTKIITYTDIHNCNETGELPANNGTYVPCDYCIPNWILNSTWSECYANDKQYKNYYDTNNCNETESKPAEESGYCNYGALHAPVLNPIDNITVNETALIEITTTASDPDNDTLTFSINDTRFIQTSDTFSWQTSYDDNGIYTVKITVSDGNFTDSKIFTIIILNIPLVGDDSSITTNIDNLTLLIGNSIQLNGTIQGPQTVEFKEGNETCIEFVLNFSSETLDLTSVKIEEQPASSTKGSLIIGGINPGKGQTKTVYMDNIANLSSICIKDMEIASISEISGLCIGQNETLVSCDNIPHSGYLCENLGSKYKIANLSHSGIIEYAPYCGDGSCNNVETCSSCPTDCGTCQTTTTASQSPSGGGGAGGGGYFATSSKTTTTTVKTTTTITKPSTSTTVVKNETNSEVVSTDTTTSTIKESSAPTGMITFSPVQIGGIVVVLLLIAGVVFWQISKRKPWKTRTI